MIRLPNEAARQQRHNWDGRTQRYPVPRTQYDVWPPCDQCLHHIPSWFECDAAVAEYPDSLLGRNQVAAARALGDEFGKRATAGIVRTGRVQIYHEGSAHRRRQGERSDRP